VAGGTAAHGANCGGPVPPQLLGHNLDDDASCGPQGAGDLWGADARLAPLQDNGGPTPTLALLEGSAAIDAGGSCPPPAVDQPGGGAPAAAGCATSAPSRPRRRLPGLRHVAISPAGVGV
jgi:hypothetical protein